MLCAVSFQLYFGKLWTRDFQNFETPQKTKWRLVQWILNNMISQYELVASYEDGITAHTNGYKLLKKLGEGTYANVFLSEFYDFSGNETSYKRLACKIIDTVKAPKEFVLKFLPRELEVLRKINHPHIIRVHSIYQKGSKYLVFMRYAEKGDLLELTMKGGTILENQTRMWVKQISLAIQYLHELEIAHRDLKCENILITSNFNAKLADFGFSRYVLSKSGIRVLSETYCGSASYAAPEVLRGIPYNPKVSDLWSLGVVIFVVMNKAMPFDEYSIKKLYEQQINRKWKFRPSIDAVASKEVKELLKNLLEPSVERRYTIEEVLNSDWMYMDHRILGMSEEESLALVSAKEERKKMDEDLLKSRVPPRKPVRKAFRV